ncbi:MAG: hypothetical protein AAF394_16315 [Planctomycetota bacterium]
MNGFLAARITKPHMIGRSFITQRNDAGKSLMNRDSIDLAKDLLQVTLTFFGFECSVPTADQVRWREVQLAIESITAGRDRRGIRGPHESATETRRYSARHSLCSLLELLLLVADKSQST